MPPIRIPTFTGNPLAVAHAELVRARAELPQLRQRAEQLRDQPYWLTVSLTSLLRDSAELHRIASASRVHPNGFAKVVLQTGDGYSVRLHAWRRRDGLWVEDTQPHGHRWVFASWVVVGTLREDVFAEDDDAGQAHDRYAYARDDADRARVEPKGAAGLRRIDTIERVVGTVYGRDRDILHTATPVGDDLVASLVLQGPRHSEPTRVYVPAGRTVNDGEEPLDPGLLRSLVAEVLSTVR